MAKGVNSNPVQKAFKKNGVKSRVELYNLYASRVSCKYLGDETVAALDLASWECSKGHVFQCRPSNISRGRGCPYCNGKDIKYVLFRNNCKTLDEYGHKIALETSNGIKYIRGFINTRTKAEWECGKGHCWEATPGNIKQHSSGCPNCNSNKTKYVLFRNNCKTLDEYGHKIALENPNNIKYIGGFVSDTTKAEWECSQNHRWKATPSNIKLGSGCPYCNSSDIKYVLLRNNCKTLDEYGHKIALENPNGIRYIGGFVSHKTKAEWGCGKGHRWKATPNSIQNGSGCPYCNSNKTKYVLLRNNCETLDEYGHKIAKENPNDIKYIGGFVDNNKTKAEWECGKGHRWKTTPNNIQQGSGCPACAKCISKKEQALFLEVKKVYSDAVNNNRRLLKNTRYELDIFIPSLKKAVEFDGGHWHAFLDAIRRDTEKDVMCTEAGIALYRVKESDWDTDKDTVIKNVLEFLKA